jgi:hypothetical protein
MFVVVSCLALLWVSWSTTWKRVGEAWVVILAILRKIPTLCLGLHLSNGELQLWKE